MMIDDDGFLLLPFFLLVLKRIRIKKKHLQ